MNKQSISIAGQVIENPLYALQLLFESNPKGTERAFLEELNQENISTPDVAMEMASKLLDQGLKDDLLKVVKKIKSCAKNLSTNELQALKLMSKHLILLD